MRLTTERLYGVLDWLGDRTGGRLETKFYHSSINSEPFIEIEGEWWPDEGEHPRHVGSWAIPLGASRAHMQRLAQGMLDEFNQDVAKIERTAAA